MVLVLKSDVKRIVLQKVLILTGDLFFGTEVRYMFCPKHWKHSENITVKQFCDYLQNNVPEDALLFVCGDNQIYMHMEEDGSVFSIDDNSLDDLPEYTNAKIQELDVFHYDQEKY